MSSECNLNNTAVPCDKENGEGWQQARLSVETTYVDAPVEFQRVGDGSSRIVR